MSRLLAAAPSSTDDTGIAGDQPAIPAHSTVIHAETARELLADIGFLLVPGAPFGRGPAYLMIGLRPKPTLAHFDPERIQYWTSENGRSTLTSLEWPMCDAPPRFSWGPIRIDDRVRARNEFDSFGGSMSIAKDGDVHAALFRSDAPILAVGGHSGPADPLGVQLAGFFALLRAAAGNTETGRAIDAASPNSLYAAFLVRTLALVRGRSAVGSYAPRLESLLNSEFHRLQRDHEADAANGVQLDSLL